MKKSTPPKFYTTKQVAEVLLASERTVQRLIEADELRAHKFGRLTRISDDDLNLYLAVSRGKSRV